MDTDESEKNGAAIDMGTEQSNLNLAQEVTKGPVVVHGKVYGYHGWSWSCYGVTESQVELQYCSRGPAGQPAAEDPEAEVVEEEAQEEDQAQQNGDGRVLIHS